MKSNDNFTMIFGRGSFQWKQFAMGMSNSLTWLGVPFIIKGLSINHVTFKQAILNLPSRLNTLVKKCNLTLT